MEWNLILLLAGLALLFFMLLGVPIAFTLGFVALVLGTVLVGPRIFFLFGTLAYGKVNSFGLVAVPLFIFMAEVIIVSGAAKDAFSMLNKWIGGLPAGLAIASLVCGLTLSAVACAMGGREASAAARKEPGSKGARRRHSQSRTRLF